MNTIGLDDGCLHREFALAGSQRSPLLGLFSDASVPLPPPHPPPGRPREGEGMAFDT